MQPSLTQGRAVNFLRARSSNTYLHILVGEPALFLESLATPQRNPWHVEGGEVGTLRRPHEEELTPKGAKVKNKGRR